MSARPTTVISVRVPATSANLGPGFDVLGVAVQWHNDVRFEADALSSSPTDVRSLSIGIHGEGVQELPRDDSNLAVKAAYRVFKKVKKWPKTLHVTLANAIPLSRGLGSSAAATLGGVIAANVLVGKPLDDQELLDLAVRIEGHPDNVVPAFAGGLCVSGVIDGHVRYFKMPAPGDVRAVVCSPDRPLATSHARSVLPAKVPMSAAVFTSSRTAFLLGAFLNKQYDWLSFAMDDVLHQPARAKLIPGLMEAIAAAKDAGAYGSALSGAGSSVVAFCKPGKTAESVGHALEKVFAARGIPSRSRVVALDNAGVQIQEGT